MALNASGQISLAGTTAGQSVQLELGGNGTTLITMNDATARTLAGIASGAIALSNFYGKSSVTGPSQGMFYGGHSGVSGQPYLNTVTRINRCGALIGSETTPAGTARGLGAGAAICTTGVYYGGYYPGAGCSGTCKTTRINKCGALVGSETAIDASYKTKCNGGASIGTNAVFYGGWWGSGGCYLQTNRVRRVNSSGALVGSVTTVGSLRDNLSGTKIGSIGLYSGGAACRIRCCCGSPTSCYYRVAVKTRINACGALVGEAATVNIIQDAAASVSTNTYGLFYGGSNSSGGVINTVTKYNACGTIIGACTNVGTARYAFSGGGACTVGIFYGGWNWPTTYNTTTRINACRALVGTETSVSTTRGSTMGAGV